jgi:hypothetical protein
MPTTDADMSLDFDAPQFVDFTAPAAERDEAHIDSWFGEVEFFRVAIILFNF